MFRDIEDLLKLARTYSEARRLSLSSVATYSARQGALFQRLENGSGITVRRKTELFLWFSENWPSDVEWPADVPRPEPEQKEIKK